MSRRGHKQTVRHVSCEQAPLKCQLCEQDGKVQWKCIECERLLCGNCKEVVHPKFPGDHRVVDIKELGNISLGRNKQQQLATSLNVAKPRCSEHTSKSCDHYCKSCCCFVCAKCVAGDHRRHDFVEIGDEYKSRLQRLKVIGQEAKVKLQLISKKTEQFELYGDIQRRKYDEIIGALNKNEKVLIEKIKENTKEVSSELKISMRKISEATDQEENKLRFRHKTLKKALGKIDEAVELKDTERFFHFFESVIKDCDKAFNVASFKEERAEIPSFIPGDLGLLPELYGKLEYVPLQRTKEFEVIHNISTELPSTVDLLVSNQGNSLWVANAQRKTLQNGKIVNDSLKLKSPIEIELGDMAYLGTEILMSVRGSSVLKILNPDNPKQIVDTNFSVAPFIPLALHVTNDDRVIVGTAESETLFPVEGPRQIVVMDIQGRIRQVFETDRSGNPLFSVPTRVASTRNTIAVLDIFSENLEGRVVILDNTGLILNIYKGYSSLNLRNMPCFMDIVTLNNNFLVSDSSNHVIHILNYQGDLVSYINTGELGIDCPYSLSVDKSGVLYIACEQKSGSGAKMYVLAQHDDEK